MTSYFMEVVGDTLRVNFATTDEGNPISAPGDRIVKDVQSQVGQLIASGKLPGGNLLKIHGRISLPASYTLAHELAHLYRAIAVSAPRLGAYIVVSSTTADYPFASRIDFHTNQVKQVPCATELSVPSFLVQLQGDVLYVQINQAVSVDGDQIVRDVKAQLQKLTDSGRLSGGNQLLKVNGRSTVLASWVIGLELAHRYGAIAVFDPKLGTPDLDSYIVAISHSPDYHVGDMIQVKCKPYKSAKIVLCGFKNTGKTVFRDGLKDAIRQREDAPDDFYVISGCPDGEGAYFSETAQRNPDLARQLKDEYKAKFTPEFAIGKAHDIEVIKNSLLLFDVGGKISPENELIMAQATHGIILAKSESEVSEWQCFCQKLHLPVIAIIYSDINANTDTITSESPLFTGTVHRLHRGEIVSHRPLIQALAKRLVEFVP
ncbi:MAG: hypothetical protein ACOC2Z_06255 [Coleofasciculus sp.]